jgi:hypothetical protein
VTAGSREGNIFCSVRKHRTPARLELRRRSSRADSIPTAFA